MRERIEISLEELIQEKYISLCMRERIEMDIARAYEYLVNLPLYEGVYRNCLTSIALGEDISLCMRESIEMELGSFEPFKHYLPLYEGAYRNFT